MTLPKLRNCPKCQKVYLWVRDICDNCYQKQEEDYLRVADYLREYPGSNIYEVSEATGVTVAQIRQFILADRILVGHFENLEYPCETCGTMIKSGKKCPKCLEAITQLAKQMGHSDEAAHPQDRTGMNGGYIKKYL
ncbi:hypothetical protein [Neobacillus jeddahensis]|uniref:hypothetical protein n=1 Tax=Neobacillus jeddahensis TaxID=1461580 RepID=UPI0005A63DDF|nr:hypothetical protein [Neobacillus jeddahensis]